MQINKPPTYLLQAQHICILFRSGDLTDFKMRLLDCSTAFALVGLLVAAPTSNDEEDEKDLGRLGTQKLYPEKFVIYKAEHDIVELVLLPNSLNSNENLIPPETKDRDGLSLTLFFVEADVQPDGSRVDQGLYVLKEGKATKILDYGRDAAASGLWNNSTKAFFGAKDGLYVYNPETNSADKYGPITDSIIAIDVEKLGEVIYILTEDRDVYKVTDNGEKKEKLDDVVKPKQIVLDHQNNLYFFSEDNVLYVRTADGVKKIEGLPEATGSMTIFKSPVDYEYGVPILIDNQSYFIYSNGSNIASTRKFEPKSIPTAIAEMISVVYLAHDKKIYEFKVPLSIISKI